jgi:hypothetical protein
MKGMQICWPVHPKGMKTITIILFLGINFPESAQEITGNKSSMILPLILFARSIA